MRETVKAYVLLAVEIGHTDDVIDKLREIDEAVRVAVTTGQYDIIVLVEVESLPALSARILHRTHQMPPFLETSTSVVEKMYSV